MAYVLTRSESVAEQVRRVADEQIVAAMERLAAGAGDRALDVHETRKAMKSLRALLRLVRGALDPETRRREGQRFGAVARELAAAREASAAAESLAALAARTDGTIPEAVWALAQARLAAAPGTHVTAELPADVLQRTVAALTEARDGLATWTFERDGWDALAPGLARTYSRGRAALGAAAAEPSTRRLHEWRKRVKDQQYQTRLLRRIWAAEMAARREALDTLGECLGDDHDLAALGELLAGPGEPPAASPLAPILRAAAARRAELQAEAFRLGARLYVESPRAFGRRIGRYFRTSTWGE